MSSRVSSMYRPLMTLPTSGSILTQSHDAKPLHIVTGSGFTSYDVNKHGEEPTHVFAPVRDNQAPTYLMNTGAVTALKLIELGHNVIIHGKDSSLIQTALDSCPVDLSNVCVMGGDLSTKADASDLLTAITAFAQKNPTNEVRLLAYQSFAQGSGTPFKIMPDEDECEIIRAARRRINFTYNMAAIGYWLLEEQQQQSLRIVAMSALAAHRPSYGLVADTMDKAANEVMWKTFYIEANHLTGKPVSVVQINPGITTACDVYRGQEMYDFIHEEALADGFPMKKTNNLPQISADIVGEIAARLLKGNVGDNLNEGLSSDIIQSLYGGYSPLELREIFAKHVEFGHDGSISLGLSKAGPDHLFAAHTTYGKLPEVSLNGYHRISLTPMGQGF